MPSDLSIRPERPGDDEAITAVTEAAFRPDPHGDHNEHNIIRSLRDSGTLALSLVAELDGRVVGHIAFSPVTFPDHIQHWYGLGPVAVIPEHQHRGIGQALVKHGLQELRQRGATGCVVLGEPGFYSRFGFANNKHCRLAGVPQEYFLSLSFNGEQASGEAMYDPAFFAGQ